MATPASPEPTATDNAPSTADSTDSTAPTTTPTAEPATTESTTSDAPATPWQAIYSPQYNAYYFYNPETQQTTWENPLLSSTSTSTPPNQDPSLASSSTLPDSQTPTTTPYEALQAAAIAAGIDPALAHLDPTLLASVGGGPAAPAGAPGGPATFTAKFNARTGQFTRPDAREPAHLSEHARATRMSEFYFDVKAWEEELAQRGGSLMGSASGAGEYGEGGEGRKRKRPTKKDLERFKEQKRLKKIAKTAWLRT